MLNQFHIHRLFIFKNFKIRSNTSVIIIQLGIELFMFASVAKQGSYGTSGP